MNWKRTFSRNIRWNAKNLCKARTKTQLKFSKQNKTKTKTKRRHPTLTETERKQIAQLQEWEPFLDFEDQCKKQELAGGYKGSQEPHPRPPLCRHPSLSRQGHRSALSCLPRHHSSSLPRVFADQPNKSDAINYAGRLLP